MPIEPMPNETMPIEVEPFGKATGGDTHTVTLRSKVPGRWRIARRVGALKAVFCDYGAVTRTR